MRSLALAYAGILVGLTIVHRLCYRAMGVGWSWRRVAPVIGAVAVVQAALVTILHAAGAV